jgi:hypothetical protein
MFTVSLFLSSSHRYLFSFLLLIWFEMKSYGTRCIVDSSIMMMMLLGLWLLMLMSLVLLINLLLHMNCLLSLMMSLILLIRALSSL